jgi:TonB family protein
MWMGGSPEDAVCVASRHYLGFRETPGRENGPEEGVSGLGREAGFVSRSKELARQHRRVLLASLSVAVLVHLGLFALNPSYSVEVPEAPPNRGRLVVSFGVPQVLAVDGESFQEDDDREIYVANWTQVQLSLLRNWPAVYRRHQVGGSVSVRLRLGPFGRVVDAVVVEGSGDLQKDRALETVARSFVYRWIPPDTAVREVELIQSVTVERPLVPVLVDSVAPA